jgi:hypothetical protein
MGMYDDIRVTLNLPGLPDGHDHVFQTKSLECMLDDYWIYADGTLWHEDYDTEDHSDPQATGIMRFSGMFVRVNKRWRLVTDYTGEIEFHSWDADQQLMFRFSAYFVDGRLVSGPHRLQ